MNFSMNTVTLAGRLGADVEIFTLQNGGKKGVMRLATTDTWKDDASGEWKERTEWHTVVTYNTALIDNVLTKYAKKGNLVMIKDGELRTRKWEHSDGSDRYSTEVVMGFDARFKMIEAAGNDAGDNNNQSSGKSKSAAARSNAVRTKRGPKVDGNQQPPGGRSDLDDEIPF